MKVVIVIDAQKDFIEVGRPFGSEKNEQCAERISKFLKDRKELNEKVLIAFTQDYHSPDVYNELTESNVYPIHCVPGTEGFEIVECLKEFLGISFRKNSFASIELTNTLLDFYKNQNNEQETIEFEIVGFCFDICVLSFSLLLRSVIPNANISVFKNLCGSSKDDDNYINAVENIYKANAINVVDYKGE